MKKHKIKGYEMQTFSDMQEKGDFYLEFFQEKSMAMMSRSVSLKRVNQLNSIQTYFQNLILQIYVQQ